MGSKIRDSVGILVVGFTRRWNNVVQAQNTGRTAYYRFRNISCKAAQVATINITFWK
jgi:hypothetical protein